MTRTAKLLAAAALATTGLLLPVLVAPALAAVDNSSPERFIQTLTTDGFQAMRTGDKAEAKASFRKLLASNVAVDEVGDRLIRRWLPTITPAQKAAYKAVLPAYLVGTYADNLFNYADATVKIVRTQPMGAEMAEVFTQVTKPGRRPIQAIWQVSDVGGQWKVSNIQVAGINVALAQSADFDSVIQRQGFDALVKMMKARAAG